MRIQRPNRCLLASAAAYALVLAAAQILDSPIRTAAATEREPAGGPVPPASTRTTGQPEMGTYAVEPSDLPSTFQFESNRIAVDTGARFTELERAKLDLARAAIERAKMAPHSHAPRRPVAPSPSVEHADAQKLERLRGSNQAHPSLIDLLLREPFYEETTR